MAIVNGSLVNGGDAGAMHAPSNFNASVYFGWYSGVREWSFARFTLDAAIPSGATINSANWDLFVTDMGGDFYVYVSETANETIQYSTWGERPACDSGSTTTYPNTAQGAGAVYISDLVNGANTVNIASLIQHLVNTYGGLAAGAHIVVWISGTATAAADNSFTEYGEANPSTLTINYTSGPTQYSLIAGGGVLTLTGAVAAPVAGRRVAANVGLYNLNGAPVLLLLPGRLVAEVGAYLLTGANAGLLGSTVHILSSAGGVYALTGAGDVSFLYSIPFEHGVYGLVGANAQLSWGISPPGYFLGAGAGSYALGGQDAGLRGTFKIWADNVAYAVTGAAAAAKAGRKLSVAGATYLLSGVDALLVADHLLAAETGTLAITGVETAPGFDWLLPAEGGAYILSGAAASLVSQLISGGGGSYVIVGSPATLIHGAGGAALLIRRRRR